MPSLTGTRKYLSCCKGWSAGVTGLAGRVLGALIMSCWLSLVMGATVPHRGLWPHSETRGCDFLLGGRVEV